MEKIAWQNMQLFYIYSKKELPVVCKYFLSFAFLLRTGHAAVTGWTQSSMLNQICRIVHLSLKELSASPRGSSAAIIPVYPNSVLTPFQVLKLRVVFFFFLFLLILQVSMWWSKFPKHRNVYKLRQMASFSSVTARLRRKLRGLPPLGARWACSASSGDLWNEPLPSGEREAATLFKLHHQTAGERSWHPQRDSCAPSSLARKKREEIYRGIM